MLLGVVYHATYAWLPDIAPWYLVADASAVPALVAVTGVLHAFRMQLFFALSGFFSHLVFERRGPSGFVKDRGKRIVVPFLVALGPVLALDIAVRTWSRASGLMSPAYEVQDHLRPSPLHLWFLVYLFTFCVLAWLAPAWTGPSRAVRFVVTRFPPALLVLALPTCVGLWLHPENRPDAHFWPMPFEVLHYGVFFAFGWWLWDVRGEARGLKRWAWPLTLAGAALAVFVFRGPLQWEATGHVLSGLVAWLLTLGPLGFALGDGETAVRRPALRFLVEASYWVYLVHYPVVLALQVFFATQPLPGLLEYLATVVLTFSFAFVTFALFVRRTWLGPWLGVKPVEAK